MIEYKFRSEIERVNSFGLQYSDTTIKNEPMFFNSSFDYAMENGGEITRAFLNALPLDWKSDVVFDSRVHMLMKDWYPCIPGWHHDDVPRSKSPHNQPDYDNLEYKSEHILGLINAEVCPTLFAIGDCVMPKVNLDTEIVYQVWDEKVKTLLSMESLICVPAISNLLYKFDYQTFHCGTKALKNGWRWFGRISRNTNRVKNITNEIRANAQVYLEIPNKGW